MTDPTNTLPTSYQSGMLKPCPFCGKKILSILAHDNRRVRDEKSTIVIAPHDRKLLDDYEDCHVVCLLCGGTTAYGTDRKHAIRLWNRREKE